jgi:hypothetical protein
LTVFVFTDKAQRLLGEAQGNVIFDIVIVIVCIAFLVYTAFVKYRKEKSVIAGSALGVIVFLFFFSSWFMNEIGQQQYLRNKYSEATTIYQNREYKIVEGIVSVLHMEPEGGHDSGDIIKINDVEFEFRCASDTFGYNKTIVYGGVLTEGTFARVFYYQEEDQSSRGRIILRIDLLDDVTVPIKKIDPLLPCAG